MRLGCVYLAVSVRCPHSIVVALVFGCRFGMPNVTEFSLQMLSKVPSLCKAQWPMGTGPCLSLQPVLWQVSPMSFADPGVAPSLHLRSDAFDGNVPSHVNHSRGYVKFETHDDISLDCETEFMRHFQSVGNTDKFVQEGFVSVRVPISPCAIVACSLVGVLLVFAWVATVLPKLRAVWIDATWISWRLCATLRDLRVAGSTFRGKVKDKRSQDERVNVVHAHCN